MKNENYLLKKSLTRMCDLHNLMCSQINFGSSCFDATTLREMNEAPNEAKKALNDNTNIINFDPNFNLCGNRTKKVVRLIFGLWEYRYQTDIEILTNTSGLDAIGFAIECLYEKLCDDDEQGITCLILTDINGNELECDDEGDGEDWLKDILISAEIISFEPAKKENTNE